MPRGYRLMRQALFWWLRENFSRTGLERERVNAHISQKIGALLMASFAHMMELTNRLRQASAVHMM